MKNDTPAQKKTFQQSLSEAGELFRKLAKSFSAYAGFTYLVMLLVGITMVVFLVTQGLQQNTTSADLSQKQSASYSLIFDQTTIQRIKALASKTQTPSPNPNRPNPFTE